MRLPFIIRSRVNDEWRKERHEAKHEAAKREISDKREIIAQNAQVQESQRDHIADLYNTVDHEREQNADLLEALKEEQAHSHNASLRLQQQEAQYAGDLQLERARYDDFVRDMLEKVIAPSKIAPSAPRSSPPGRALPREVQDAIDEIAGTDEILRRQQEDEAWRRLAKSPELKPDALAELFRQGDRP
ncbi:MAG: hypothetical protein M3P26_05355 [Gemmatimonadota bacterium]|nr:hypothetical protein [Gemmatimonadota bacterium]